MFQLCTDFLKYERRVAPAYQRVQQLLGVAQQKTVGLFIKFSYFVLDAAQQAQLIQMTQGKLGRLVTPPLSRTLFNSHVQQIGKRTECKGMDCVALRTFGRIPFADVCQAIGGTFSDDAFVECSILHLDEQAGNPRIFV